MLAKTYDRSFAFSLTQIRQNIRHGWIYWNSYSSNSNPLLITQHVWLNLRDANERLIKKWIYFLPSRSGRNWIWNTMLNSEEICKTLALVVHLLQTTQNLVILITFRAGRSGKECSKNYNLRAQPSCWSLKLLFSDFLAAAAVVVFLKTP